MHFYTGKETEGRIESRLPIKSEVDELVKTFGHNTRKCKCKVMFGLKKCAIFLI